MKSHLKWIDNLSSLEKADQIVMAGVSAGGGAAYLWIDYVRDLVSKP